MDQDDLNNILLRPIIVISSSEEEPRRPSTEEMEFERAEEANPHVTLWENDESEQRMTLSKMASFQELMELEEKKEEENRQVAIEVRPNIAEINKERERKRKQEQQLRKDFASHAYLPVESLKTVKRLTEKYEPGLRILSVMSAGLKE